MKKLKFVALLISLSSLGFNSFGTPLRLDYETTDIGGGLFEYDFKLELDNNDGSWLSGQGWRWLVFGDALSSLSPLADFVLTSQAPGPWDYLDSSTGQHNGPTFGPVLNYWIPTSIGDFLVWSGTSSANVAQGDLLFSTLAGTLNRGVAANFEVANRVKFSSVPGSVPDNGSTLALFGAAFLGLIGLRRRFGK